MPHDGFEPTAVTQSGEFWVLTVTRPYNANEARNLVSGCGLISNGLDPGIGEIIRSHSLFSKASRIFE